MADNPKMPPRNEEELAKLRALFEGALNEAAEDPEKMWALQREKDKLVEPWDRLREKWNEIQATRAKAKTEGQTKDAAKDNAAGPVPEPGGDESGKDQ